MELLSLSNLKPVAGSTKKRKRVGRGNSSGHGTYSTRGMKGQKSRSGGKSGLKKRAIKEQFLLKTPKMRGFKSHSAKMETVNLGELNKYFDSGGAVTPRALAQKGLIASGDSRVKILGEGTVDKSFQVYVHAVSKKAKDEIEKNSGKIKIIK